MEIAGQGILVLLSVFTAYKYGRLVEKNEQSEKEKKSLEEVRRLRDGFSCADVVERVRRKFKR